MAAGILMQVSCGLCKTISQTIGIDFYMPARGPGFVVPQTVFGPLPLNVVEACFHLLHLCDGIGMLQTQGCTDDMFLCERLLGLYETTRSSSWRWWVTCRP